MHQQIAIVRCSFSLYPIKLASIEEGKGDKTEKRAKFQKEIGLDENNLTKKLKLQENSLIFMNVEKMSALIKRN